MAVRIALTERAARPSRPRGANETWARARMDAKIAARGSNAMMHGARNCQLHRNRLGLYAPRTLDFQLDYAEAGVIGLLMQLFASAKMNGNRTELVTLEPTTLSAAPSIGSFLRHLPPERALQSRFSSFP
jgi:hypothetical protein